MKDFKAKELLQLLYPLFLYYIVYTFSNLLFLMLFQEQFGKLFCLLLAAFFTLPFIYLEYKKVPKSGDYLLTKKTLIRDLGFAILIVIVGISLNVAVSHLPLQEISKGFENANNTLSDGELFVRILSNAIVIPVLEELLYRGIICTRLSVFCKPWISIVISSVLFGIMHFNVIQFLYAFVVGLILGFSYIKTKNIFVPILGHGCTNLIVILYFMN